MTWTWFSFCWILQFTKFTFKKLQLFHNFATKILLKIILRILQNLTWIKQSLLFSFLVPRVDTLLPSRKEDKSGLFPILRKGQKASVSFRCVENKEELRRKKSRDGLNYRRTNRDTCSQSHLHSQPAFHLPWPRT